MAGYQYKTSAVAFRDEMKGRNLSENQRKQLNEYKKRFASVYKGIHIKTTKNGLPTY